MSGMRTLARIGGSPRVTVTLAAVFCCALTLRLVMLHTYAPAGPWVAALTLTDAEMGRQLLSGRGWVANASVIEQATKAQETQPTMVDLERFLPVDDTKPDALVTQGTAHSPGYAIWFAISYWLGGSVRYVHSQVMQAVLDASACLLVFGIGRRVWSSTVGLIAAGLYALSAPHAFLANLTVAASTDSFWFLTVAYGAVRSWEAAAAGRRPWAGAAIITAGAFCGAAMNSTSLVLPAAVTGMTLVAALLDRRALRITPYVIAAQLAVFLLLTPWALRNERLFGQFSPVRGGFWQVAFASWGELPNPWGLGFDDKYYWNWIEEECDGCDSGQQAEMTRRYILSSVVTSPGYIDHMVRLVTSRLPRLLGIAEVSGGIYHEGTAPALRSGLRTFLQAADYAVPVVAGLVIIGFVFVVMRPDARAAATLALTPSIFLIGFSLVFFVELRKTMPAYGALMILAAIAVTEISRRGRATTVAALVVLLVQPSFVYADIIGGGQMHTAVVKPDGTVWSWGLNMFGQLGDGRRGNTILEGVQAVGLSNAVAVATGASHTVVLRKDGSVWAWGDNFWGELGNGRRRVGDVPAPVPGLPRIVAVAAGYLHSLALAEDGTLWGWGDNHHGQLGVASPAWILNPIQIPGLPAVASIDAGFFHSAAIDRSGRVLTWGLNNAGQLGDGTLVTRSTPSTIASIADAAAISGGQLHTLLLKKDGSIWSWGGNTFGQLGRSSTGRRDPNPAAIASLTGVTAIAAGEDHSLALTADQHVWAWGDNLYGQVADGTWEMRGQPVRVRALEPVIGIASGEAHVIAMNAEGTLFTWGFGSEGQLGDNTIIRRRAEPRSLSAVAVVPGPDFESPDFTAVAPTEGTWMAPVVKAANGGFLVKGTAETPTAYVIAAAAVTAGPNEAFKEFAARGTVNNGCVTVGIQQSNRWVFYKNYSQPGPFTLTWLPPASGAYAVVVAHCLPEDENRNDFEIAHLGWFSTVVKERTRTR